MRERNNNAVHCGSLCILLQIMWTIIIIIISNLFCQQEEVRNKGNWIHENKLMEVSCCNFIFKWEYRIELGLVLHRSTNTGFRQKVLEWNVLTHHKTYWLACFTATTVWCKPIIEAFKRVYFVLIACCYQINTVITIFRQQCSYISSILSNLAENI